jgi:DNA-binding transcriptional LysR family regulator
LDFCFIWATRDDASEDISVLPLGKDELRIMMTKDHRLARKQNIRASDLRNEVIYLTLRQTRTNFYDGLSTACHAEGFAPDIRTDVIQVPFIMNIVSATQAISFIPDFFSRIRPYGTLFKTCHFLPKAQRIMPLALAFRSRDLSPLVKNFVTTCRSFC